MADKNQDEREDEPLAEADAVQCEPKPDECGFVAGTREGKADESEFSLREEIFETFAPQTIVMVPSPVDGMPIPSNERSDLATAHPFTRETIVCLEDDTEYVELFAEELAQQHWGLATGGRGLNPPFFHDSRSPQWTKYDPNDPNEFTVAAISCYDADGHEVARRSFMPHVVQHRFGVAVVERTEGEWLAVRPKRERCQHYMRQVMANDDAPNQDEFGHFIRFYNCAARKSVGGAMMTLRDEAIYACDYRSPPDPATTERYLDAVDRKRLDEKRHLEFIRPFNLKD